MERGHEAGREMGWGLQGNWYWWMDINDMHYKKCMKLSKNKTYYLKDDIDTAHRITWTF